MYVTVPMANLVSGVSQQAIQMRTATALKTMVNAWPSMVSGLNKRNGSEFIGNLGLSVSNSASAHIINKNDQYQYIMAIANGAISVFDLKGNQQVVTSPRGLSYLAQAVNPVTSFRYATVADTTFILNRDVAVDSIQYGEVTSPALVLDGTVATYSALPAAPVVVLNYYVTDTQTYWKNTLLTNTTTYKWNRTGTTSAYTYTSTTGDTSGSGTASTVTRNPPTVSPVVYSLSSMPTSAGLIAWIDDGTKYVQYTTVVNVAGTSTWGWVKFTVPLPAIDVTTRLDPSTYGTVYVTNSLANAYYNIYINNILKGSMLTGNGLSGSPVQGTDQIAAALLTNLNTNGITGVTRVGSTLSFAGLVATDTIICTSSQGDTCIKSYRDTIDAFSNLPPNEVQGRIVTVKGLLGTTKDSYYVKYVGKLWVETYGWNTNTGLNPASMPWTITRQTDGSWIFDQHVWNNRVCGDDKSAHPPSFIGQKLADMFIYTDRLGFLAGSNLIMSSTDVYENFYRTTAATLVDSDPMDFSVFSSTDDQLRHAVPFNKDLLILADRSQYRLQYQNYLGPKTATIQYTTAFPVAQGVKPINMGSSLYFADDRAKYTHSKIYEYTPKLYVIMDEAKEVTEPVPQMLPANLTFMSGTARSQLLILGSSDTPTSLLVYKFFVNGDSKIQNAWGNWTFNSCSKIEWAKIDLNYIYLITTYAGLTQLERICIDDNIYNVNAASPNVASNILLDRQVTWTASGNVALGATVGSLVAPLGLAYSGATGQTVVTLPYTFNTTPQIVVDRLNGLGKVFIPVVANTTNTVTVNGDITASIIWAGIPFTMEASFSPPYPRFPKGNSEVVALDGRFQLRYFSLGYTNTPYFNTVLTTADGAVFNRIFTSLDKTGTTRIPLLGRNVDLDLKLQNDGPFACQFTNGEWSGMYSPRTKRL